MKKWLNSISNKILLGYGAILLTTLITALPLLNTSDALEQKVNTFVKQTLPQLETLVLVSKDLKQLELHAYSLYGLTMGQAEFISAITLTNAEIDENIVKITGDNQHLNESFTQFKAELFTLHETMSASSVNWESAREHLVKLSSTHESMAEDIDNQTRRLASTMHEYSGSIVNEMSHAENLLLVLILFTLAVALTAYLYSRKQIAAPIKGLSLAANRITEGDFQTKIDITTHDEIGMLADTFNHMQSGIAKREDRLFKHAHFDDLTGVANSVLMVDRINNAIKRAEKDKSPLTLALINLKQFKDINTAFGHAHGDAVLKEVSKRILAHVRDEEIIARTNGDKFLLILEDTDQKTAKNYTSALIKRLTDTVEINSTAIILPICAGLASFPEHGSDANALLQQADIAMNQAKKNFTDVGTYQCGKNEDQLRQLSIIRDLRNAVETDQMMLYYQPKVDAKHHNLIGVEALIRWTHPELGFMSPDEFIPVAESSGNINLITRWVLKKAVQQCQTWNKQGLNIKMSVNLSAIDLLDQSLPEFVLGQLAEHDVKPSQLVLEITESTVLRDTELAHELLNRLKNAGINLSIDDYGTDYSSLAKLRELPVQELKIDKSFILNMIENENDTVIVKSTIDLGHNMGLRITAEGVEDQATLDLLNSLGCDEIQGYFISRPLPINDFATWLSEYKNNETDKEKDKDQLDA